MPRLKPRPFIKPRPLYLLLTLHKQNCRASPFTGRKLPRHLVGWIEGHVRSHAHPSVDHSPFIKPRPLYVLLTLHKQNCRASPFNGRNLPRHLVGWIEGHMRSHAHLSIGHSHLIWLRPPAKMGQNLTFSKSTLYHVNLRPTLSILCHGQSPAPFIKPRPLYVLPTLHKQNCRASPFNGRNLPRHLVG